MPFVAGRQILSTLNFGESVTSFKRETGESGDINVCSNKTLSCYPNYTNGLYSENNLSNKA